MTSTFALTFQGGPKCVHNPEYLCSITKKSGVGYSELKSFYKDWGYWDSVFPCKIQCLHS